MRILSLLVLMSLASLSNGQEEKVLVSYSKGPCFGQCPIYSITVSEEGLITFVGERFLAQVGTYERELSKREFRKLKCLFRRAKMRKIPSLDESNIMDAQTTRIKYKDQFIERKTATPSRLQRAENYLLALSPLAEQATYQWKVKPKDVELMEENEVKELAQQEIIIQMNPNEDFNSWLKDYSKYGLSLKKKLVPNRELYLLAYEPKILSFKGVLKKLNSDPAVQSAEENKKVEQR